MTDCTRERGAVLVAALLAVLAAALPAGCDGPVALTDVAARSVAVDDTHLYYKSTLGEIGRVPKSGGTREVLWAPGVVDYAAGILLDEEFVYWFAASSGVQRVAKTGGEVESLFGAGAGGDFTSFAVGAASVYVASGGLVRAWDKATGAVSVVVTPAGAICAMGADATDLYWLERAAGAATLLRQPQTGGSATTVASGLPPATYGALAFTPTRVVYVANGDGRDQVVSVAKSGGAPVVIAEGPLNYGAILEVVTRGEEVLWNDFSTEEILAASATGGSVRVLAEGQRAQSLAADAGFAYWAHLGEDDGYFDSSAVRRVAWP